MTSYTFLAQSLNDLDFGTDTTFDVVTWNIENFPKNGEITMSYVADILEAIDADIIAVQEISDRESFQNTIDDLTNYEAYYTNNEFQNLGYVVKSSEIEVFAHYEIYTGISYPSPFTKPPFVIEFTYMNEDFALINNHYKCCGNGYLDLDDLGDEETRRFYASVLIKDFIDTYMPDKQVIVLGDLNDVLTDIPENNVFQSFIDDPDNFLFADMEIALGSNTEWSYPTWPSHIDHILITNELFDEFGNSNSSIQTIKIEEYLSTGWSEYDTNVSDHRPVGLKLASDAFIGINDLSQDAYTFYNFPNPASSETTFYLDRHHDITAIIINSITGQEICVLPIVKNQNTFVWYTENIPSGLYFARLISENISQTPLKILISR